MAEGTWETKQQEMHSKQKVGAVGEGPQHQNIQQDRPSHAAPPTSSILSRRYVDLMMVPRLEHDRFSDRFPANASRLSSSFHLSCLPPSFLPSASPEGQGSAG